MTRPTPGPSSCPGTGVGTGGAVSTQGGRHRVFPSEGGHVDFAPRDAQQEALLRFLRPLAAAVRHANVSDEFVFCGEGIRRIHAFLRGATTVAADTPRPEVITAATDPLSVATTDLYVKLIGAAAGNLALTFAATGGRLPRRVHPAVDPPAADVADVRRRLPRQRPPPSTARSWTRCRSG